MMPKRTIGSSIGVAALFVATSAFACGFENPALVAKGMLNWVYPKSFYVDTAVWQAQREGVLPREEILPASKTLLVNPGYRRAVGTLQEFALRTAMRSEGSERDTVIVLLMEAVLYSRITYGEGKARLEPHVSGSGQGEPIIVTHRVVIEALNAGILTPEEAISRGLVLVYGGASSVDAVLAVLGRTYSVAGVQPSQTDSIRR